MTGALSRLKTTNMMRAPPSSIPVSSFSTLTYLQCAAQSSLATLSSVGFWAPHLPLAIL